MEIVPELADGRVVQDSESRRESLRASKNVSNISKIVPMSPITSIEKLR